MKLSLVALCLSVSIKFVCGSFLETDAEESSFWDFSKGQTLEGFKTSIEQMMENDSQDLLENISGISMVSAEKRVWYTAAYYETLWQASADLVSLNELDSNIDSIVIAENPKFVDDLPPAIRFKAMNPAKVAWWDAVGLARTLAQVNLFAYRTIETAHGLHPRRILELRMARDRENFNLELAIKNERIGTLDNYIRWGIWTPCMDAVHMAIRFSATRSILYLLGKVKKIPSAYWLNHLVFNGCYEAIDYINSSNPDWGPSQEEVDEACAYGWNDALKLYFFVNPNLRPSNFALLKAQKLGYSSVLEFGLKRWPQYCLTTIRPECALNQYQIDNAASKGHWRFLSWCSDCNPEMNPPSENALEKAHGLGHDKIIKWAYSRFPSFYSDRIELGTGTFSLQ